MRGDGHRGRSGDGGRSPGRACPGVVRIAAASSRRVAASTPPRVLTPGDTLVTGAFRFRHLPTPHLPHGWDAGVMFEESQRVLFCGDLFTHNGDVAALTESDVLGRARDSLAAFQAGPLMDYMPYTPNTGPLLEGLAALQARTLAIMHGSSFRGDCARALRGLDGVMKEMLGSPTRR